MGAAKYFGYLMILAGLCIEFFTFQLCSKAECYFLTECGAQPSVGCLSAFFAASLILIVGGAYILKKQRDKKYT